VDPRALRLGVRMAESETKGLKPLKDDVDARTIAQSRGPKGFQGTLAERREYSYETCRARPERRMDMPSMLSPATQRPFPTSSVTRSPHPIFSAFTFLRSCMVLQLLDSMNPRIIQRQLALDTEFWQNLYIGQEIDSPCRYRKD